MVYLINNDCLIALKELVDNSIDFCMFDPPYGKTKNERDKPILLEPLWQELKRIVKSNGAIALFCQGTFYIDLVNSNRKMFRYDIVWDKVLTTGFLNAKKIPLRQHEQIAIFYKKLPTYNPHMMQGKPLHGKGIGYKNKTLKNQNYGAFHATEDLRKGSTEKYPTSIISISKPHPSKATHATQKPVELMELLIRTYTNEGDTVLDCCMGSGVVGIAAKRCKRNYVGIEKYSDTYKKAENEINKEQINGTE